MEEALLTLFCQTLPSEIADLLHIHVDNLRDGRFEDVLSSSPARILLGHEYHEQTNTIKLADFPTWNDYIFHHLSILLGDRTKAESQYVYFCVGYAALLAFVQSNITGPVLPFSSAKLLLPHELSQDPQNVQNARYQLISSLGIDGVAAHKLTLNIELFCLADAVMTCPPMLKNVAAARWGKLRVQFVQQKLLSETSSTLQSIIYDDLEMLEQQLLDSSADSGLSEQLRVNFLLERSAINTHHGLDRLARADLESARALRHFDFALTGLLGKRTKYQEKDISQLVVLAKSTGSDTHGNGNGMSVQNATEHDVSTQRKSQLPQPTNLDLNDDTLLESISFSEKPTLSAVIQELESLPSSLSSLDPSNQPQLEPLDSVILLSLASSITNTSPADGLTREETLPYATRVLQGGSSNWQVYTQALLVRSRIEGYKSRTIERGLLQLQALVDQIVADTTLSENKKAATSDCTTATAFLPKAKESENAHVSERLLYVFQLASPTRLELETELAARWVQLGGLRSAVEIYERLEMWAEVALCWAGTNREDRAKKIVRRQLHCRTDGGADSEADDNETWEGAQRDPPPADAPRLYCILGDLDQSLEMYKKAWQISNERYSRAQRSLGRMYFSDRDYVKAAEAYSKSLRVNKLNHISWFALGCALLELEEFDKAIEAFSRCVQLDEQDAEAWSNLAAALLKSETQVKASTDGVASLELDEESETSADSQNATKANSERNKQNALNALKRAASLKRESYRIWENVLTVAMSLSPPDYAAVLAAQKQLIVLRGSVVGEQAIDAEILGLLVRHVMSSADSYDPGKPGLGRMVIKLMDENVVRLITASATLWQLVAKLALWRNKPASSLEAEEKAWRAIASQPGWDIESEKRWDEVVESTLRLCDAYESLGPKEKTEGMGAGELVAKDWKFKARVAIRGIMGRGKDSWVDTVGWGRLKGAIDGLKG